MSEDETDDEFLDRLEKVTYSRRLIALARDGIKWREYRNAPDPLGEALNSGDGVYRP